MDHINAPNIIHEFSYCSGLEICCKYSPINYFILLYLSSGVVFLWLFGFLVFSFHYYLEGFDSLLQTKLSALLLLFVLYH